MLIIMGLGHEMLKFVKYTNSDFIVMLLNQFSHNYNWQRLMLKMLEDSWSKQDSKACSAYNAEHEHYKVYKVLNLILNLLSFFFLFISLIGIVMNYFFILQDFCSTPWLSCIHVMLFVCGY